MFKTLQSANLLNSDIMLIVIKVVNSCKTCIKFRKPLPRPIVAFLKADDFNETVSDLRQLQPGLWHVHIIDEFTKFSAAAIIMSKSHFRNIFVKYWIAIFSASKKKIFSQWQRVYRGQFS